MNNIFREISQRRFEEIINIPVPDTLEELILLDNLVLECTRTGKKFLTSDQENTLDYLWDEISKKRNILEEKKRLENLKGLSEKIETLLKIVFDENVKVYLETFENKKQTTTVISARLNDLYYSIYCHEYDEKTLAQSIASGFIKQKLDRL